MGVWFEHILLSGKEYRYVASITEFAQQDKKTSVEKDGTEVTVTTNQAFSSTLRELRALACLLETSFLPLNNTGVSR
jgi:hypothetical protein